MKKFRIKFNAHRVGIVNEELEMIVMATTRNDAVGKLLMQNKNCFIRIIEVDEMDGVM